MDESDLEFADRVSQAERDAGAARATACLTACGQSICCDCGDEIEEARRLAAPFAIRCIDCQQRAERKGR